MGATQLPVICAGSIVSADQIHLLGELGVWSFTVGTAVLNRTFVPGVPIEEQIRAVLGASG